MWRNLRSLFLVFICIALSMQEARCQTLAYRHLQQLCDTGDYEEAIRFSTEILKTQKNPVPKLFYWRAYAFYNIGWFEQAERDLVLSPDYREDDQTLTPRKLMGDIQAMKTCLPPDIEEVKNGGQVIFRVYHDSKDPLAKLIIKTLPKAYDINAKLLGTSRSEQPVFIFPDYRKHKMFMRLISSGTTVWASASRQGISFCTVEADGSPSQYSQKHIQQTVIHEYNHNLFLRVMGNAKTPNWFIEGLAEYAVEMSDKEYASKNDRQMAVMVEKNTLLAPASIEDIHAFQPLEEVRKQMIEQTNTSPSYSAYTQSYHMTRYLIGEMPENGLIDFLNAVKQTKSFNQGLLACFSIDLNQFYQFWYKAVQANQR